MSIKIETPKSLKQIANEMQLSNSAALNWIKINIPQIEFIQGKRKRIYTPFEVNLIYKEYGLLED